MKTRRRRMLTQPRPPPRTVASAFDARSTARASPLRSLSRRSQAGAAARCCRLLRRRRRRRGSAAAAAFFARAPACFASLGRPFVAGARGPAASAAGAPPRADASASVDSPRRPDRRCALRSARGTSCRSSPSRGARAPPSPAAVIRRAPSSATTTVPAAMTAPAAKWRVRGAASTGASTGASRAPRSPRDGPLCARSGGGGSALVASSPSPPPSPLEDRLRLAFAVIDASAAASAASASSRSSPPPRRPRRTPHPRPTDRARAVAAGGGAAPAARHLRRLEAAHVKCWPLRRLRRLLRFAFFAASSAAAQQRIRPCERYLGCAKMRIRPHSARRLRIAPQPRSVRSSTRCRRRLGAATLGALGASVAWPTGHRRDRELARTLRCRCTRGRASCSICAMSGRVAGLSVASASPPHSCELIAPRDIRCWSRRTTAGGVGATANSMRSANSYGSDNFERLRQRRARPASRGRRRDCRAFDAAPERAARPATEGRDA